MSKELHLSIYSEHLGLQSFMFYGVTVAAIKYAEFLSNDPEICAAHIIAFFHTPEEAQSGHMVKLLEFSRSCFFFVCVELFAPTTDGMQQCTASHDHVPARPVTASSCLDVSCACTEHSPRSIVQGCVVSVPRNDPSAKRCYP
jgi:hypothetical protein